MPTFNAKPGNKKVGRWKDKIYSKQIMAYIDLSLKPSEKNVYKTLFDTLAERFNINEPNEIMLLDLAVNDYIRVKRLHLLLKDETDIVNIKTRTGQIVRKAHEAGYLINAVQNQFRQNMKELLLTPKESLKKTIGTQPKDFTDAIGRIVDGDYMEDDKDDKPKDNGIHEGTSNSSGKEEGIRDEVRRSEQPDRTDGKTTGDSLDGRPSQTAGEVRKTT